MNFIIFFFILIAFTYLITTLCKRNKFLLSYTGDKHQKFASNLNIPLAGGIVLFFSFCFLNININFIILILLIFFLGFISDLKNFIISKYSFFNSNIINIILYFIVRT